MRLIALLILLSTHLHADVDMTFVGDVTLGTDSRFSGKTFTWQYNLVKNPAWFTDNIRGLLDKDDLTVANLEGVIADNIFSYQLTWVGSEAQSFSRIFKGNHPDVRETFDMGNDTGADEGHYAATDYKIVENNVFPSLRTYRFKGKPEYLNILKQGSIELVNIANNHLSKDYGMTGLNETKKNLDAYGIDYYGYSKVFKREINGSKVCVCGNEGFDSKVYKNVMLNIKELRSSCDILIYTFHWGIERDYAPTEFQTRLAHYVIDNGADLVVGHHPHVIQPIEYYKGKPIVYSLGNFIFGGNNNPSDLDAMVYQIKFKSDKTYEDKPVLVEISSETNRNNFKPQLKK